MIPGRRSRRAARRRNCVDGVTGPGPPSKQAALATALLGSALRAACLEGGRSSLTLMVLRSQRDEPRSKHQGETTMNHYAGIDVSLECSSVCVVDASGKILREARVASEPEALIAWFRQSGLAQNLAACVNNTHARRSEEHTSELQSRSDLVCRLLL